MERPFALLLGGKHSQAILEIHDIFFTMAESIEDAFSNVSKTELALFEKSTLHIDSWIDLQFVDGHQFKPKPSKNSLKLFFINIGFYETGLFGEKHHYSFFIAESKGVALKRARSSLEKELIQPHKDNLFEIDSILEVSELNSKGLYWEPYEGQNNEFNLGYFKLSSFSNKL